MKIIIDRFEGDYAVVEHEDGNTFSNLPLSLVPEGACEGDVIQIEIDTNTTKERHRNINSMLNQIFNKENRKNKE